MVKVYDFLPEFIEALKSQLIEDDKRWGNTWLELRHYYRRQLIEIKIINYFNEFYENNKPVPWLKIAGYALIAWICENHPELQNK